METDILLRNLQEEDEILVIPACDGIDTLETAGDLFSGINILAKKTPEKRPTKEMLVDIYRIAETATFDEMFRSIGGFSLKHILTENQVMEFIKKYPSWFSQKTVFFLCSFEEGGLSVINVYDKNQVSRAPIFRYPVEGGWVYHIVIPRLNEKRSMKIISDDSGVY